MPLADKIKVRTEAFEVLDPFKALRDELNEALSLYWTTAVQILQGSEINVLEPTPEYFSIENNFFSLLFLYSYFRAGIPKSRRILYAVMNQCLRGMVTGCDNILDDEYKKTLHTDLPEQGTRFRSVLDIMVSDRILFSILYNSCQKKLLTPDQVMAASSESLRSLAGSGVQEASEEGGTRDRLTPEQILSAVHHYKTAKLFQCPWAIPSIIEKDRTEGIPMLKDALYQIGMGCQILDDMVDLSMDLRMNRHNYITSLIGYGTNFAERDRLKTRLGLDHAQEDNPDLLLEFPDAMQNAKNRALAYLNKGIGALFAEEHQFAVDPAIIFIAKRISADHFLFDS